jgi:hypothetical protein
MKKIKIVWEIYLLKHQKYILNVFEIEMGD